MSSIHELLEKLCPEGVVSVPLIELSRRNKGMAITAATMKKLGSSTGSIKVFAGGKTVAMLDESEVPEKFIVREPSVVVRSRGNIGVSFCDVPFTHKAEMWSYTNYDKRLNIKYLYYYLMTKVHDLQEIASANSVKMAQIQVGDTDRLSVPLPPIEVQNQIAEILDTFTDLEAELEAELEARRKQYEYYRNQLLSFPEQGGVRWVPMGEICQLLNGFAFKSDLFNSDGVGVPLIRIRDINSDFSGTYFSGEFDPKFLVENDDILIGMDGDFKAVKWSHGPALLNQRVCKLEKFTGEVLPNFVYHYLQDALQKIQESTSASTVKHLSSKQLNDLPIPIPSRSFQEKSVSLLERLDFLVNDISNGLPAEIDARRKQYEHYRDKLLTFKEFKAS